MKENELIGMKNKIASLTNIVQYLLQENQNITQHTLIVMCDSSPL